MENNNSSSNNNNNNFDLKTSIQNSLQKDILYFKDDILKDIKTIENNLNSKISKNTNEFQEFLEKNKTIIEILQTKITEINNKISNSNFNNEKIEKFFKFKENAENNIYNIDIKLNNLYNEYQTAIYKYDKILSDSVIYPGLIGPNNKLKTFHNFIDFCMKEITSLNNFKEKSCFDLKEYKNQIENLDKNFIKFQKDVMNNNINYLNIKLGENEEKFKQLLSIQDKHIFDVRLENSKFSLELTNQTKNLINEWKKISNFKEEFNEKLNEEINKFKNEIEIISKKFENEKNEFEFIKERFNQLNEIIKDFKFNNNNNNKIMKIKNFEKNHKNLFKNEQKNNENNFSYNNNDIYSPNSKKSQKKIESYLRKYIDGEVNIKQIYDKKNNNNLLEINDLKKNSIDENNNNLKNDSNINNFNFNLSFNNDFIDSKNNNNLDINTEEKNNDYIRNYKLDDNLDLIIPIKKQNSFNNFLNIKQSNFDISNIIQQNDNKNDLITNDLIKNKTSRNNLDINNDSNLNKNNNNNNNIYNIKFGDEFSKKSSSNDKIIINKLNNQKNKIKINEKEFSSNNLEIFKFNKDNNNNLNIKNNSEKNLFKTKNNFNTCNNFNNNNNNHKNIINQINETNIQRKNKLIGSNSSSNIYLKRPSFFHKKISDKILERKAEYIIQQILLNKRKHELNFNNKLSTIPQNINNLNKINFIGSSVKIFNKSNAFYTTNKSFSKKLNTTRNININNSNNSLPKNNNNYYSKSFEKFSENFINSDLLKDGKILNISKIEKFDCINYFQKNKNKSVLNNNNNINLYTNNKYLNMMIEDDLKNKDKNK